MNIAIIRRIARRAHTRRRVRAGLTGKATIDNVHDVFFSARHGGTLRWGRF